MSADVLLLDDRIIAVTPALVRALGGKANEAIVLQQLHWWMRHATAEHDGHRWVWNTYEDWAAMTGLTPKQARTAIGNLVDRGVVVQHAPESWDRTRWYRIDYDHEVLAPSARSGALQQTKRADDSIYTDRSTEREPKPSSLVPRVEADVQDYPDEVMDLAREFAGMVKANGHALPSKGSKAAATWLLEMDRLRRIGPPGDTGDDPPPTDDEIREVMAWALQRSTFWPANIRALPKFRQQYTTLRGQMRRDSNGRALGPSAAANYEAAAKALRDRQR